MYVTEFLINDIKKGKRRLSKRSPWDSISCKERMPRVRGQEPHRVAVIGSVRRDEENILTLCHSRASF